MAGKDAYDQAISKIHAEQRDPETVRVMELAALVELGLGHPLDPRAFNQLAEAQADLRDAQERLNARLESHALGPDDYVAQLNVALVTWTNRSLAILGNAQFLAIFGEAGRHPEGLIDREKFLEEVGARRGPA